MSLQMTHTKAFRRSTKHFIQLNFLFPIKCAGSDGSYLENQKNKLVMVQLHICYITEKPWTSSVRDNKAHLSNMFGLRDMSQKLPPTQDRNELLTAGSQEETASTGNNKKHARKYLLSDPDLCPVETVTKQDFIFDANMTCVHM